jgi:hypothetical protein
MQVARVLADLGAEFFATKSQAGQAVRGACRHADIGRGLAVGWGMSATSNSLLESDSTLSVLRVNAPRRMKAKIGAGIARPRATAARA